MGGALQPDRVVVFILIIRIDLQGEPHTDDRLGGIGVVGHLEVGDVPVQCPAVAVRSEGEITPGLHVLGNVLVPVDGDPVGFRPDVEALLLLVPHALDEFAGVFAGATPLVIFGQLVEHPEQTHHVDVVFGRLPLDLRSVGSVAAGEAATPTGVLGLPQQPFPDAQRAVAVLRVLGDVREMGQRHSGPGLVAGRRSPGLDVRHAVGVEEVLGSVGVSQAPVADGVLLLHLQQGVTHGSRPVEGIGVVLPVGVGDDHQRVVVGDGVVPEVQDTPVVTRRHAKGRRRGPFVHRLIEVQIGVADRLLLGGGDGGGGHGQGHAQGGDEDSQGVLHWSPSLFLSDGFVFQVFLLASTGTGRLVPDAAAS